MNFYKNVIVHRGKLLVRGVLGGKDYTEKLDFGPTMYVLSQKESEYKTLQGQNLKPIKFNTISQARKFKKEIETEIFKAQKEKTELKKNSVSDIQNISKDLAADIIENISGDKLNESSIKAAVDDVSKKNIGKYL